MKLFGHHRAAERCDLRNFGAASALRGAEISPHMKEKLAEPRHPVGDHSTMETLSSGPEPRPAQPVLSVQRLSKRFGALAALNDLSFDVEKGEIFGIAGPNGAGKSTLLNVCTGALAPTSGGIFLDGERVDGLKPYRLCHRGLARTFQVPRLFETMTVHENVATGAMFGEGGDGRTMKQLVGDILALTGLLPSSDMPIASANLLTRKMTMLAAALATRPKLIFMDEPLAGFLSEEIDHFVELIAKLHGTLRIDFIVIEHKVRALTRLCDRIMIMHYGSSICIDVPEKALRDKQVIEVYLGAEYFA
jgi:branched-chain amino acid transport system ATP-binding protein